MRVIPNMSGKAVNGFLRICRERPNARNITLIPLPNGKYDIVVQRKKLTFWQEFIIAFADALDEKKK